MDIDAVVGFLSCSGFSIKSPLEYSVRCGCVRVALEGDCYAAVTDSAGYFDVTLEYGKKEQYSYYDLLNIHNALDVRENCLRRVYNDVCGKTGFENKEAELADECNRLANLRIKTTKMLKTERSRQLAKENLA